MLKDCLKDLKNQLQQFDIESCLIGIYWDEDDRRSHVRLSKINNTDFDLNSLNDFDTLYSTPDADLDVYANLLKCNLKISEMAKLYLFIRNFEHDYNSNNKIQYPKPTFWRKFKYKHFNIDYYSTRISEHYTKV